MLKKKHCHSLECSQKPIKRHCSQEERKLRLKVYSLFEWTSITCDVVGRILIDRKASDNIAYPSHGAGLLLFNILGNAVCHFDGFNGAKLDKKTANTVGTKARENALKQVNPRQVAYVSALSTIEDFCIISDAINKVGEEMDWEPLGASLTAFLRSLIVKTDGHRHRHRPGVEPSDVETWMFPMVKGLYVYVVRDIFRIAETIVSDDKLPNELYLDLVQRWNKCDDGVYSRLLLAPESTLAVLLQLEGLQTIPKSVMQLIVAHLEADWEQVLHRLLTWPEFKFTDF